MPTSRPFAYNTCSIDDNLCDTIQVTYQLKPSCETISVTYTLEGGDPVTVEVGVFDITNGRNRYNLIIEGLTFQLWWNTTFWSLLFEEDGSDQECTILNEDVICPFGTYEATNYGTSGVIFEAFEVNPITIPDPVTVEVEKESELMNGKNQYIFLIDENETLVYWSNFAEKWAVFYVISVKATLSDDAECPFGTYTIEEDSIFSAFSVGCVPVPIPGTEQVGDLAIGFPTSGFEASGLQWWNGADEELGYVICVPVPGNNQPTPIEGITSAVGFFRTGFNDNEFVNLANSLLGSSYTSATASSEALTNNGYWNSYTPL
jgi:hypothetical protein